MVDSIVRNSREARVALERVARRLNEVLEGLKGTSVEAMQQSLNLIEEKSNDIVPVATGELRDSSFTDVDTTAEGDVIGTVGYTAKHAAFVHELVDHKHPNGGEAKFLEKAAIESEDEVLQIFASEFGKRLG